MKRLLPVLVIFSIFLGNVVLIFNASAQSTVSSIKVGALRYKVPLPEGFCDATESVMGLKVMIAFKDLSANNPGVPTPKKVYRLCTKKAEFGFPWGFVGVYPKDKYINNQEALNTFRKKYMVDKAFMEKFTQDAGEKNRSTLKSHGFDLGRLNSKHIIMWADDNVIISTSVTKTQVNGVPYNERLFSAGTVLDGTVIEFTTYDELDGYLDPKAHTLDLAKNAQSLKSMN